MALGVAANTIGKVIASTVFMCVCSMFRPSDFLLFVKNGLSWMGGRGGRVVRAEGGRGGREGGGGEGGREVGEGGREGGREGWREGGRERQ